MLPSCSVVLHFPALFFFFKDTATTEIYTLSLHDALPIWWRDPGHRAVASRRRFSRRISATKNPRDRKSTRLNSSHQIISYAVFCLKKKKKKNPMTRQTHRVQRKVARTD